ncbi:Beta-lactamase hydrolase-like protein [Pseudovibrio sp. Ad13]|uniref:beta-lactamase hydrolase domain-containing protein n=1 Tax=Pseudovibrio sp. Ad13 TaxID=989396 RepID=UPI0007AEC4D8|nr:sulfur transferase domain-containing protein [Pseudovibrio sp. Ad13]KZK80706.1 Beta-lactamase hydrolase-like protein [Pseudovibrio sp. Ad13]
MFSNLLQKISGGGGGQLRARQLTEDYWLAGQLYPEDMEKAREQGFRSIVCNRPDDEAPNQPTYLEVSGAAEEQGLEHIYIPIGPGTDFAEAGQELIDFLAEAPRPVLAYCRSGNRSTMLWRSINM